MSILKGSIGSKYGLKGNTPELRAGAFGSSKLHVQGKGIALSVPPSATELDLDGIQPSNTYSSNLPR